MHLTSALAASALAAHASAFLLPLEVVKTAEVAKSEFNSLLDISPNTVELDCPGCPFFSLEDTTNVESHVDSHIHLEFGLEDKTVTVNGKSLALPHSPGVQPMVVTAPQIRTADGQRTQPIPLDYAWESLPPVTSDQTPDVSVLPFELTILGLQGHPVKVDTVSIHLLQTPGQSSIVKISKIPFSNTPGAMTCTTDLWWSICRLKAIATSRFRAVMENAKMRAHGVHSWVKGQGRGCRGQLGNKGGRWGSDHGHHRTSGHGGDHHHHRAHHLGRLLHQTLRFFVIPALLGVIGGLVASAIGMIVGQLICFFWIRCHRGGRRTRSPRVVEVVVEDDEKDSLMAGEDGVAPPSYDDLDIEKAVTDNEKK